MSYATYDLMKTRKEEFYIFMYKLFFAPILEISLFLQNTLHVKS